MNENLHPRFLERSVRIALADTPVVVIQGARQVGKSTLARMVGGDGSDVTYVTLDDPSTRAIAEADPAFFVSQGHGGLLVIDEAQRGPGLILPLKAAVDRDRRPGRFLLTGSADLLQVKGVADSLAGRAESVELKPLSQGEIGRRGEAEDFVTWLTTERQEARFDSLDAATVIKGGYPEAVHRESSRARAWFSSYVERLANHDARDLRRGGYADHFGALLSLVASGGQQELVKAKAARSLGVSEGTLDSYVRLAAAMRLVEATPAWSRTPRGRVTRRPKMSLNDTGLAAAIVKFTVAQANSLGGREFYGTLVEQFVVQELRKQCGWSVTPFSLAHFRDLDGLEVDLVLELDDGRLIAIEVKAASVVDERAWAGLERFRSRFADREVLGVCFHAGTTAARLRDWLHVLPITALWQH